MPATLREVLKTNTFEEQRQLINTIGLDFKDYVEGSGFSSTLRLDDGSSTSPAVFFDSDVDLGFYKRADGILRFVSGGSASLDISDTRIQPYKTFIYESADAGAISPNTVGGTLALGEGYPVGTYTNQSTLGGTGSGLTIDFVVLAFEGNITNTGSGYAPGTYNTQSFVNISSSGSGGTANIVVAGLETSSLTGGSNYDASQTFTNVPLQGGNGSGAIAALTTNDQGIIDSFAITNQGDNNYQAGDILTVNNVNLTWGDPETQVTYTSGGSGFQLVVNSNIYTVSQVNTPSSWSGTGYAIGDTVSATLDGVGSNFVFEFTNVGFIDSGSLLINEVGLNYTDGDIIRPNLSASTNAQLVLTLSGAPIVRASINTAGDAIFNSIDVANNVIIDGSATISGVATIGSLNLLGSLTGATLSGDSISVAGSIDSGGSLSVTGAAGEVSEINGDISLSNNLFQIDDINNLVSINGPTGSTVEDYLFEVYGISKVHNNFITAVDENSGVSIGEDPGVGINPVEKLVVTGNTQTTGNYYAGDGLSAAPSYSFIADKALGLYRVGLNELGLTAYNGDMARFSSSKVEIYKPLDLINNKIDQYTILSGIGFDAGLYTDVLLEGGTGADLTVDITIAFSGEISPAGSGYTSQVYTGIPLEYAALASGAITGFGTIVPGSGYGDSIYQNVSLTNLSSSGSQATADITVDQGSVSSVIIKDRGINYAPGDILSANYIDLGGTFLIPGSELLINETGSGYTNGTYNNISLVSQSGSGINGTADIVVSSGQISSITIVNEGRLYSVGDTLDINDSDLFKNETYTLTVADDGGSTNYLITGSDSSTTHSNSSDPTLNLILGDVLQLNVNAVGHPIRIVTQLGDGGTYDPTYDVFSVTNNGIENGILTFDTSLVTAGTYYYVCENHPLNMVGSIIVQTPVFGSGASFEVQSSNLYLGSGFTVTVSDVGTSGSGSGALANITIVGGTVTNIDIVDGGNNLYQINDVLTVNYTDLNYIDEQGNSQTSQQPSTELEFTVKKLNTVSYLNITDFGSGYSVNDVLNLPNTFYDVSNRLNHYQYFSGLNVNQGDYIYSQNSDYIYFVTTSGQLGAEVPKFGYDAVELISITSGGSNYPASKTYNNLDTVNQFGNGSGLKVNITTNASGVIDSITPVDELSGIGYASDDIFTIDNNLLNSSLIQSGIAIQFQASGSYEPDGIYSNIPQTSSSGSGTGAVFTFTTASNGDIDAVTIVNSGINYSVGDTILISGSDLGDWSDEEGNIFSSGDIELVINSLSNGSGNSFTVVQVSSTQINGTTVLSWFDYKPSGFSLTVNSLLSLNNLKFDSVTGTIESKKLIVDPDGIDIGTTLSINNNTISTSSGNLTLNADDNSQTVISGTGALALPSGDDSQRPNSSLTGSIRYNTDRQQFEGLIQGFYVSLGGVRDVDGNTFISAELEPGVDDNTLRFYNDGILSQVANQSKIIYRSLNTIEKHDLTGIDEWIAGDTVTAATLPEVNYVFYGENVYSIDTSGTFDVDENNFPSHTTGTVTNGTVDLTYVRSVYGNLLNKSKNTDFTVEETLTINSNALVFNPQSSEIKIQSAKSDLSIGFNPASSGSNQILKFSSSGNIQVNKGFGSQTDNYQNVLDYELKNFELLNTKIVSNTGQLDSSLTSSIKVTLTPWNTAVSGKIFVEIEEQFETPTATPQRQYSELSYLISEDGQDIIYTENNKLYTNTLLGDTSLALDTSDPKNIVVNFAHSTGSTTALYNIKVVSQVIRR